MCTALRRKKARKRLIANSRGFSSIVGAVFAVLVIISLTTTVFVWSLSQNNLYNNAVRTKNQLDEEQRSEKINAFAANYSVTGSTVTVWAPIQNLGYLPLQITRMWLKDINLTGVYNASAPLNYNVTAGANATITANVAMTGAQANHNFTSWLVTGRGNVIATSTSLMGPQGVQGPQGVPGQNGTNSYSATTAMVAQGIGSISMDFKAFAHYDNTSQPTDGTYLGNPSPAYSIKASNYTIFRVRLTNLDPTLMDINLTTASNIWILTVQGGTVKYDYWYLLQVIGNKVYPSNSGYVQTLPYNTTRDVYFGPGYDNNFKNTQILPINMLLFGKIYNATSTSDYGQNLPFVAIQITP